MTDHGRSSELAGQHADAPHAELAAHREELAAQRAELAALRAELAALRTQLDTAHVREPTMRAHLRCPACSQTKIAHVWQVLDAADFPKPLALWQRWNSTIVFGVLEAYVCTGCGFVEWYAREPGRLALANEGIEMLDGVPETGPYR